MIYFSQAAPSNLPQQAPLTFSDFSDLNLWVPVYAPITPTLSLAINPNKTVTFTGGGNIGSGNFFVTGMRSRLLFFPDTAGKLAIYARFDNVDVYDAANVLNTGVCIVVMSPNEHVSVDQVAFGTSQAVGNTTVGTFNGTADNVPTGVVTTVDNLGILHGFTIEIIGVMQQTKRTNGVNVSQGFGVDGTQFQYRLGGGGGYNNLAANGTNQLTLSAAPMVGLRLWVGFCSNGLRTATHATLTQVQLLAGSALSAA